MQVHYIALYGTECCTSPSAGGNLLTPGGIYCWWSHPLFPPQGYHELLSRQHAEQEELSGQLDEQDVRKMEELFKVSQQEVAATLSVQRRNRRRIMIGKTPRGSLRVTFKNNGNLKSIYPAAQSAEQAYSITHIMYIEMEMLSVIKMYIEKKKKTHNVN